jgi:hypothetical protein
MEGAGEQDAEADTWASEVAGEWRRLHNEELQDLCSTPNIVRVIKSRKDEIGKACSMYGGEARCIQGFGG